MTILNIPHDLLKVQRRASQVDGTLARRPIAALAALQQLEEELDRLVHARFQTLEWNPDLQDLVNSDVHAASRFHLGSCASCPLWARVELGGRFRTTQIRHTYFVNGGLCKTDA